MLHGMAKHFVVHATECVQIKHRQSDCRKMHLLICCICLLLFRSHVTLSKVDDGHHRSENITFLKSLLDSKTMNSLQGVYKDENGTPVRIQRATNKFSVSDVGIQDGIDSSKLYRYSNLIDFTKSDILKERIFSKNRWNQHSVESKNYQPLLERGTLLVFTTCNHVNMSIHSLESISSAPDEFDILVIDDHSIDGTVHILNKKGFSVISKPIAKGLTDSWNIGYYIATLLKYRFIIFSNNDVLVPHGSISIVQEALEDEALIVPLTTRKGAGHNPTQSIETQFGFHPLHIPLVNNPSNFQYVQDMLMEMFHSSGKRESYAFSLHKCLHWMHLLIVSADSKKKKSLVSSKYKGKQKFNGFFFAINLKKISSSAYNASHLFDPNNVMVEQEDTLMASMARHKTYPKICLSLFVYHYKSVTVKAAGSTGRGRNNLHFFHPEIGSKQGTPAPFLSAPSSAATGDVRSPKYTSRYYQFLSQLVDSGKLHPPRGDTSPLKVAFILPPHVTRTAFVAEKDRNSEAGGEDLHSSQGVCGGAEQRQRRRARSEANRKRARRGLPSCCGSKIRQDVAAAVQLGRGLQSTYNVNVFYLFESDISGEDWHDLSDVDLLVNMATSSYDLGEVHGDKATLVKVAWITDVLDTWSDIRSIGNYDLILAPSEHTKKYIHSQQVVPSLCLVKCPRFLSRVKRQSDVLVEVFPPASSPMLPNDSTTSAAPKRDTELDFIVDIQDASMDAFSAELAKTMKTTASWGILRRNCKRSVLWKHSISGLFSEDKVIVRESLQTVFRFTKVVVVKVPALSLWNGIDPVIFDALASGSWVILYQSVPQPLHGLLQHLPLSSDLHSLREHIELFLSETSGNAVVAEEKSKYQLLRREILEENGYGARSTLLATTLKQAGMIDMTPISTPRAIEGISLHVGMQSLCIGITTAPFRFEPKSTHALGKKIIALIRQFVLSPHHVGVRLNIYVLQPMHTSMQHVSMLKEVIDECERVVQTLGYSQSVSTTLYWNDFYLSDEYASKNSTKQFKQTHRVHVSPADDVDDFLSFLRRPRSSCDWCTLSHMNWTHTPLWMDAILPAMTSQSTSVISWDFLSTDQKYHSHPRTHIVRVGPELGKSSVWCVLFRLSHTKNTTARFISLSDDNSKGRAEGEGHSICNENSFASSLLHEVSPMDIIYLHSRPSLQLMNDSTKREKKRHLFNFFQ